jgi:hypothetical protein
VREEEEVERMRAEPHFLLYLLVLAVVNSPPSIKIDKRPCIRLHATRVEETRRMNREHALPN